MWWNKTDNPSKNSMGSDEYERLLKRIIEVDSRTRIFETEIKLMQTNLDNLRGKFNQRLKAIKESETTEETKDINTNYDIPFG